MCKRNAIEKCESERSILGGSENSVRVIYVGAITRWDVSSADSTSSSSKLQL